MPDTKNKNLEFANRLRSLIGEETQAAFGKKIGLIQQDVARLLAGHVPGPKILLRISEVTGRSINWLLTGEEAPLQAAKEKAEALAQAIKEKGPAEIVAEGPPPLAEADRDSGKLVEAIKELLPPAFGDQAALLISIMDYLGTASAEDRETIRRLVKCLSGGSEKVHNHLLAQLELVERLTDFEKGLPLPATPEEEEKKRAAG